MVNINMWAVALFLTATEPAAWNIENPTSIMKFDTLQCNNIVL